MGEKTSTQRKVALVTGGGSGIGLAAAEAFLAKGYTTVLLDRDEQAGQREQARLRSLGEVLFIRCDVTDDQLVRQSMERAVTTFGRLDAAFNAAGIDGERGKATADCTMENWNRVLAVDLTGLWSCMRYEIPHMLASGGGSIVNCSSVGGITGAPFVPAYVAAKHGVVGLTRAAALEYARNGIRVNAVCPGMIDTPMSREFFTPEAVAALLEQSPTGRLGQPKDVAAAVLWLCEDGGSFVTGQAIAVDGGWTAR